MRDIVWFQKADSAMEKWDEIYRNKFKADVIGKNGKEELLFTLSRWWMRGVQFSASSLSFTIHILERSIAHPSVIIKPVVGGQLLSSQSTRSSHGDGID
jgi:hypothetical protein